MNDKVLTRRRRQWALALISRAPVPPPIYGSAAWIALPEGDPSRIAAVVCAAEGWARDGDDLEQRLRDEVAQSRRSFNRLDDELHCAAVVPLTRARNVQPFAERRRRQGEAARPRPTDRPGSQSGDAS